MFFFNDTATTEIYPLTLHDALPIWPSARTRCTPRGRRAGRGQRPPHAPPARARRSAGGAARGHPRSEEYTSELQSRQYLVSRLLLEQKTKVGRRQVLIL